MSKKSFKDSPALRFVSSHEPDTPPAADAATPAPAAALPETKSKRFNMLMRPSLFARLKRASQERGISVNELIHGVLEEYAKS